MTLSYKKYAEVQSNQFKFIFCWMNYSKLKSDDLLILTAELNNKTTIIYYINAIVSIH